MDVLKESISQNDYQKNKRMTGKQWVNVITVNVIIAVIVLLPFLPGPSSIHKITNSIFSIIQIASLVGLLSVPIGLIWTFRTNDSKVFPVLLWTIPLVMFTHSIWIADFVRNLSRSIAINNANELIVSIEEFKNKNNQYPSTLTELIPNYINSIPTPFIMGIPEYNYQKLEDRFLLTFTQNVVMGFNFEVVQYDPLNKHKTEGSLISYTLRVRRIGCTIFMIKWKSVSQDDQMKYLFYTTFLLISILFSCQSSNNSTSGSVVKDPLSFEEMYKDVLYARVKMDRDSFVFGEVLPVKVFLTKDDYKKITIVKEGLLEFLVMELNLMASRKNTTI